MDKTVNIIMPSYRNQEMKKEALASMAVNTSMELGLYSFPDNDPGNISGADIPEMGHRGDRQHAAQPVNYGWMKGCNLGIMESIAPAIFPAETGGESGAGVTGTHAAQPVRYDFIVLANDDILVPGITDWCRVMTETMERNPDIGVLGPLTMNAMGMARLNGQNCTMKNPYEVPFVSFFFVMLRAEAVKKTGLLDESLPGGDDLDYCLRLKEAGYKIAVTPQVFVWHHYAQTGKRVYGDYWDSEKHQEKINLALIRKHGFKKFIYNQQLPEPQVHTGSHG